MIDHVFAVRIALVHNLSNKQMTIRELERMLEELGLNKDIAKMKIADLIRVDEGKIVLTKEGSLLLQLIR